MYMKQFKPNKMALTLNTQPINSGSIIRTTNPTVQMVQAPVNSQADLVQALGTALNNQGTKYVTNTGSQQYQAPSILTMKAVFVASAGTSSYYMLNTDVANAFVGSNTDAGSSLSYSDGFGGKLIGNSLASYKKVWITSMSIQYQITSSGNADSAGLLASAPKIVTYLPDGSIGNEVVLPLQANPSLFQSGSYLFNFENGATPGVLFTRGTQISLIATASDTATVQLTFAVEA